jgi:uncharacterized membrane protein HdeD (DUF308 family)
MNKKLKGAARSKTIWINALTAIAGLSALAGPLTGLLGPQTAAAVLVASGVANIVLRAITTESLEEKGNG